MPHLLELLPSAAVDAEPATQAELEAKRDGRVDGSVYSGECACLIGKHCGVDDLDRDASRPAESWFMQFRPGMTPENHNAVKLTCEWIEAWLAEHGPKVEAANV